MSYSIKSAFSMEKKEETPKNNQSSVQHDIPKEITGFSQTWCENLTEIDLSSQNIDSFDETTQLPQSLINLDLAHNNLEAIPDAVLCHRHIKHLDVSYNKIIFFDDVPKFYQVIENLNLANNKLQGPPYWVWSETPEKLAYLNLSNNSFMTESLDASYLEKLLQCNSLVTTLVVHNCRLGKYERLFGTFPKVKQLEIGGEDFSCFTANLLNDVPGAGLSKCCDIIRLNLRKTKIFNVKADISILKNLVEINLSDNMIRGLPEEFCTLEKLEICNLSFNYVTYLPEGMGKLRELQQLYLGHNELCLLTNDLTSLPKLKTVDVYSNELYELPESFWSISQIDMAQNFLVEREDADYIEKKTQLRRCIEAPERMDGHKLEYDRPQSDHSADATDDESFMKPAKNEVGQEQGEVPSSSEDWDSDRYWVPHGLCAPKQPSQEASWLYFIRKKINEGSFCPIDLHTAPVFEKVMYEKQCNPTTQYESEGQFDDLTEDDS